MKRAVRPPKRSIKRRIRAMLIGPVASPSELRKSVRQLQISPRDLIIGVDGGAELAVRAGCPPDLAIGDWDSLKRPGAIAGVPRINLRREKSRSDTWHALRVAARAGAREIVCLGLSGGRPDHHLAVLLDLAELAARQKILSLSVIGPEADYHFISPETDALALKLKQGALVSVFALRGAVKGVTLQGFRYSLRNEPLSPGSHGLSNLAERPVCRVSVKSGVVVVIVPR